MDTPVTRDDRSMTEEEILRLPVVKAIQPFSDERHLPSEPGTLGYIESPSKPDISLEVEQLPAMPGAGIEGLTWKIKLSSQSGSLRKGLPGVRAHRLSAEEIIQGAASYDDKVGNVQLGTEPFRPSSLDVQPIPRIIPLPARPLRPLRSSSPDFLQDVLLRMMGNQLADTSYPWSTIGKIWVGSTSDWQTRWTGTGVLVGPNFLLTAGHVAPWFLGPWFMRFVPAYNDGNMPYGESYVSDFFGYNSRGDVTGQDYVICRLYNPLGNTTGWLGSQSWGNDEPYEEGSWISAGYPGSFFNAERPGVQYFIKIVDIDNEGEGRELETERFANPGWSGGPLFGWIGGQPKVIGVESGEETDFLQPRYNVFAGGKPMVDLIKHGWAIWQP